MASSNVKLKSQIVNHLITDYRITESDANQIYDETYTLYHELLTLIDLEPLKSKDEKILSSLVMMITKNFELNDDTSRLYFDAVFYLVFFCNSHNVQYVFNNWLTFLCQQRNVSNGIKFLEFALEKLNHYVNKSKFQSFDSLHDVLKSLRSNINSLGKIAITRGDTQQADTVNEIKTKFDIFVSTNSIILSDESDPSTDDDMH